MSSCQFLSTFHDVRFLELLDKTIIKIEIKLTYVNLYL